MASVEGEDSVRQEVGSQPEIGAHRYLSPAPEVSGEGEYYVGAGTRVAAGPHGTDVVHEGEAPAHPGYEINSEQDTTLMDTDLESGTLVASNGADEIEAASAGAPADVSGELLCIPAEADATGAPEVLLAAGNWRNDEIGREEPVLQRGAFCDAEDESPHEFSDFNLESSAADCHLENAPAAASPTAAKAFDKTEFPEGWKDVVVLEIPSSAPSGQCDIYIVGTAHVSLESCKEVANVIQTVKPQVVFIELCSSRVAMLMPQTLQVPTLGEMLESWRSKKMNALGIIYGWFLSKVSAKLEVFPGSEFRVAYEGAMACGAKVTLGDRPVQITLRRTWAKMSLWEKTVLIYCMVFRSLFLPSAEELSEMVEGMKDNDMVTRVIQEMGKRLPTVMETLIFERDLYMTAMLRLVAKDYSTVVAVVGKGHVPGITQSWDKMISIESLMVVPNKKSSSRRLWGLLAMSVGGLAIVSGVYCSRRR